MKTASATQAAPAHRHARGRTRERERRGSVTGVASSRASITSASTLGLRGQRLAVTHGVGGGESLHQLVLPAHQRTSSDFELTDRTIGGLEQVAIARRACRAPGAAGRRRRCACSPAARAARAPDSSCHATSISASRSRSESRASAVRRTSPSPARSPGSPATAFVAVPASRRSRAEPRSAERRWLASTRRATPYSHGRASSGTSSSRRQATRNVSDTTSCARSPGARRSA